VRGEGEFLIDGNFGVTLKGYKEPRLERAQQRFLDLLSQETGIPLWRQAILNEPHFIIETAGPSAGVQQRQASWLDPIEGIRQLAMMLTVSTTSPLPESNLMLHDWLSQRAESPRCSREGVESTPQVWASKSRARP
jgi:hypothetical protein